MSDDATLIALLAALGVRTIRVTDLPQPGIGLRRHGIMLLDTDLTDDHRLEILNWALRQSEN